MQETNNLRVSSITRLASPREIKTQFPMTDAASRTVVEGRATIERILRHQDQRLLVVAGPCSIHDTDGALDYARRLNALRRKVEDQIFIVMRVYFEKPRTTIGWKGLINDPHLDGSHDIETGLKRARQLLLAINEMGLPAGTEFLDPIIPQFTADLISWAAIGARTTESQTHREMASGLSMPVGFKNGTDGGLQIAIDAMGAARHPHSFLGIDPNGATSIVRTTGTESSHVVLRGGRQRTNYDPASIADAVAQLTKAGLPASLMVDCSHANSGKQHARQEEVWNSVIKQRAAGNAALTGVMVESYLEEGNQSLPVDMTALRYGVSVTDACMSWATTERLLLRGQTILSRPAATAV